MKDTREKALRIAELVSVLKTLDTESQEFVLMYCRRMEELSKERRQAEKDKRKNLLSVVPERSEN